MDSGKCSNLIRNLMKKRIKGVHINSNSSNFVESDFRCTCGRSKKVVMEYCPACTKRKEKENEAKIGFKVRTGYHDFPRKKKRRK